MDELLSSLLRLKLFKTETRTSENSCFSAAVETVWARDPEIAGELLRELANQGRRRRATLGKVAEPSASSDDQTPLESTATAKYIDAETQTSTDSNDAVKPRAQRRKQNDRTYRPSHSSSKYTRSTKLQRDEAEDETPTSQPELPSPKSPNAVDTSINYSIRDEADDELPISQPELPSPKSPNAVDTSINYSIRDEADDELPISQPELPSPKSPSAVDASINCGIRDEAETSPCTSIVDFAAMAKPESTVVLDTTPDCEKELIRAPQDKAMAAASPALATCQLLVSEETARSMIFEAARDIHGMEMYEGRLEGEVHRGILYSLKSDLTDEVFPRLADSVCAVSRPMDWSLTMWMNILDQGRASHKKSGILRKIEWMGASAWFDCQVEQASNAPLRTKRGIPMKRVSTAVLDRMLNEAHDDGSGAPSERPIDRKAQQRKTFIDKCNKGKRLRQIVKVLGTGVLFYRRIWDLMKTSQDQIEDVVSHLSTDPAKATTLALLGEQVELLVGSGRPNTATFLDSVDAESLVSAEDASSLRLHYGSSTSGAELRQHIDQLKIGLHQAVGKRKLDHEDTITLSGKSIPGDSFNRLDIGEWFDIWLLEAALEIQDRPAWVKLGPCVSTHEIVNGKTKPVEAPFRRLRSEVESLRDNDNSQRTQDGFIFLCPLCVNTNHFTLLEINEREGMIYHYDSLSNRSGRTGLSRDNSVRDMVQKELKSLGLKYTEAPTPQQQDCSSCGPMVVRNASQRMSDQPVGDWDDHLDPAKLRASIVQDLHACVFYCGVDPDPRRSKRLRSS